MAVDKRIRATTLSEEDCQGIIKALLERYTSGSGTGVGVVDRLWDRIAWRRNHFFNLPPANPYLPPPYDTGNAYQTDILRQTHTDLIARLTENQPVADVTAGSGTQADEKAAETLAMTLTSGLEYVEDRNNMNVASRLADGLIRDCYGVLHWCLADDMWPDVPDYDEKDELDDEDDASGYTDEDYPAESGLTKEKKYRRTDDSIQEQRKREVADAGWLFDVEVVDPATVMFIWDRSLKEGPALVCRIRQVGLVDYGDELAETLGTVLSVNDIDGKVCIFGEEDAPLPYAPSANSWGKTVSLCSIWTRDEYYELVSEQVSDWSGVVNYDDWLLVKSDSHPYGRVPFELCAADETNDSDPVLKYAPALEGLYRLKPAYDRQIAYQQILTEMNALPYYYLSKAKDGALLTGEDGKMLAFTRNAALAAKMPDGYVLNKLDFETNPAFLQMGQDMLAEMQRAAPPTGQADVSASTEPWAIRMQQQQGAIVPGRYARNIAHTIQSMFRNWARVMSERTEPVWVYARTKDGKVNTASIVGVEPEQIETLNIDVTISNTSGAEQATLLQLGVQLINDPKVPLTRVSFLRDYALDPYPERTVQEWEQEEAFDAFVKPGLYKQIFTRYFSNDIVMGANNQAIGPDGQPMAPAQVLQANGQPALPAPQLPQIPTVQAPTGPTAPPPQGATMPALPPMQAPGTMPLAGVP